MAPNSKTTDESHCTSIEQSLGETNLENNGIPKGDEDKELDDLKARLQEMEEESKKLKALQSDDFFCDSTVSWGSRASSPTSGGPTGSSAGDFPMPLSPKEKMEADSRSIFIGNVDYGTTAEELQLHFHGCGIINRVTIPSNKFSGHPKGFAYVEFADRESLNSALAMQGTLFRGRLLKVMLKRTNKPGLCKTNWPPRGSSAPRIRGRVMRGGIAAHRGYSRRPTTMAVSSGRVMKTSSRYSTYNSSC